MSGLMRFSRDIIITVVGTLLIITLCIIFLIYVLIPKLRSSVYEKNFSASITVTTNPDNIPIPISILTPNSTKLAYSNISIISHTQQIYSNVIGSNFREYRRIVQIISFSAVTFLFFNLIFWRVFIGVVLCLRILTASILLLYLTRRLAILEARFLSVKQECRKNKQELIGLKSSFSRLSELAFTIFSIIYPFGMNFVHISKYLYFWPDKIKASINFTFDSVMIQELRIQSILEELEYLIK